MNSKGAPLRRRHEEETEKAARDNFRGFTKTHRTMVLDKKRQSPSATGCVPQSGRSVLTRQSTIGKKFYSDLKDEFFGDLDPTQDFEKPPESDLADERLFGCLRSVLHHNRDFVPVQSYMQEVGKLNTLILQALLRAALKIPPGGKNHDATNFLVAVMEFVADGEYEVSHPATVRAARGHFDQALVKDLGDPVYRYRSCRAWWRDRSSPGERQAVQVQLPHELPDPRHRGVGESQTQGTRLPVPWRQREHILDEPAGALHCCRGVLGANRRCGHRGLEPALLREGPCSARS